MAVLQSTYTESFKGGFPGMIANGETGNRISRTAEDAAGVAFGRPVYRGSGDHGCVVAANANEQNQLGIAIADITQPVTAANASTPDKYLQYANVGILQGGTPIWVTAGADVTDGAKVYDDGTNLVDNSTGGTELIGWFWMDTVSSGQPARIHKPI